MNNRLVLLAELILVGVLVVIALIVFRPGWNLVIALNACCLLVIYRTGQNISNNRLRRRLDEASSVIRTINEDITAKLVVYEGNYDMARFYEEVESLRAMLADKESERQRMMDIVNTIATNVELEELLDGIMPQVTDATRSICSAFYLVNPVTDMLELKYSIGFSKNLYAEFDLSLSEGIVGLTAKSREIRILQDVPADTIYMVRTFLGTIKPRNIMAVPVVNQDQLLGILVMVSLYDYSQEHIDNMSLMRYYIGVAVHNGVNYEKNKRLTNELKFQNKLIQDLNSDLERKVLDRTIFLNNVMDSIMDYAIYALDINGIIEAWNDGAENLLEFNRSEVLGKHIKIIHGSDPERMENIQRRFDAAVRDGRYTESGLRKKRDGACYNYEQSLFARYNQDGELIGFTGIIKDMTEYKNTQSALTAQKALTTLLLEADSDALMLLDSECTVIYANSSACTLLKSYDVSGHSFYYYFKNEAELRRKFGGDSEELPAVLRGSGKAVSLSVSVISDADSEVKMFLVEIATAEKNLGGFVI